MQDRPGKKPKENRRCFVVSPRKEHAELIERICRECDISANKLLNLLITYALRRMTLTTKTVSDVEFREDEDENA